VGCVDLWIVPVDEPPIGSGPFMAVSVEPPGFTNTPDAEELQIRGINAALGTFGDISKLTWTESENTSVVITFQDYSREEVVTVAEGLVIDGANKQIRAETLPDNAEQVPAELDGPTTLMQHSAEDGQQLTIEASTTDKTLDDNARKRLIEASPPTDLVNRPEGIGIIDPNESKRVLFWWSVDGLIFRIDGTNSDLDAEQLADFATTLTQVSNDEWTQLGGC